MEAPNALDTLLFRTSTAINLVGASDAVLWRFVRCWLTTLRPAGPAALVQARADLAALPPDLPGRAELVAALGTQSPGAEPTEVPKPADLLASDDPYELANAGVDLVQPKGGAPTPAALAVGAGLLQQAVIAAGSPLHPAWTHSSAQLAMVCRITGRTGRARRVALAGLCGHPWQLLLAPDATALRETARKAVGDAGEVAGTCLRDGDTEGAIRAWEIALGLEHYASVESRDLGTRLRLAGWMGEIDPVRARTDLLAALIGAPIPADGVFVPTADSGTMRLLDVPGPWEVLAALAKTGLDALVYLVPTGLSRVALVVPACGQPFRTAFEGTIGALLDEHFPARHVRLGLVPLGELRSVQWHAAGEQLPERVTVTYPGSARLLCDAASAAQTALDGDGLVVARQDDESAVALRNAFLPRARVTADSRRVLSWLENPSGGPAVHISASRARDPEGVEHLMLTGKELDIGQLCAAIQASGRGLALITVLSGAPGELANRIGFDTMFRASGVRSVIAARWPVRDRKAAAVLMYLVHHELSIDSRTPLEALNRAQQILCGARTPAATVPAELRRSVEHLSRSGDRTWAAFVHSGW